MTKTAALKKTDPAGPQLRPGIGKLLRQAYRTYSRKLQDQVAHYDVSLAQYLHLRELWEENGVTQNELSQKVGIEKASSTAVLDALERQGLIKRARNLQDRRKVNVYLTPAGDRLRERLSPAARMIAAQAVNGLAEPEVAALFSILGKMVDNLENGGVPLGNGAAR